jgi:hypothetical protein
MFWKVSPRYVLIVLSFLLSVMCIPGCENQKGTFLNRRDTYAGAGQSLLKDEGGFKSKIKLRIKPKIPDLSNVISRGLDLEVCAPPCLVFTLLCDRQELCSFIFSCVIELNRCPGRVLCY